MDLENIVSELLLESNRTPVRALSAIAQAEKYLQQAYEGRYFFELIQNVRDANKEIEQDGIVLIELKDNKLTISNTGAEFSQKGIEGITTIGESTKDSQDFIGFKGIGFKSVQDITDNPKIITHYGSVFFDREQTLSGYDNDELTLNATPLFFFPYFEDTKLSKLEYETGVVTKIELPVKKKVLIEDIVEAFLKVQARQLILLGNIKEVIFKSDTVSKNIRINKNASKRLIEVVETEKPNRKFRYFSPTNKISIPENIVNSLDGKEKEMFTKDSHIDINIVVDLDERGRIIARETSKLYLFYPLNISSGFRFIIHSYFIVNPERTALRESPLNNFLLEEIGKYIGNQMLKGLKKFKADTTKTLCFKRNSDAELDILYDSLVTELKDKKFIFDNQTRKYYSSDQVIVADGFDKGLFPDGKFADRQLIYTDDKDVVEWLEKEFDVLYLTYADIANEIEDECQRQLKAKNIAFFQNLYNYVTEHEELNLSGKKVLLTNNWKLVSSAEDVFYGGTKIQSIKLSNSIQKEIYFIHSDIKITGFREGRSRTGITEFNTYELVRRLLKLFSKPSIPNADILNSLYTLSPFDKKSELEIIEKIKFPVKGSMKWLSPLTHPIYFDIPELKELYPEGNFIDDNILSEQLELNSETMSKEDFLIRFGVWMLPAVYIKEARVKIEKNQNREKIIDSISNLSSKPFYIYNDRVLDIPKHYTSWFTKTIIDNWRIYKIFIQSDFSHKMKYANSHSHKREFDDKTIVRVSGFIDVLSTKRWILFSGCDEAYSSKEMVGIETRDYHQGYNKVLQRYLTLIPISYELKKDMLSVIGLIHLNAETLINHKRLLKLIYEKYKDNTPPHKDFIDFYNRILGKLVDFFHTTNSPENIIDLKDEYFLSINNMTQKTQFEQANRIFYIDDKPNYEILPHTIKEKVQPHFTNRDKNTFGKIAGKIGNKFSNSIKKELLDTKILETNTSVAYFPYLSESIAMLESMLERRMDEYFEIVKNIRVFVCKEIHVKISVSNLDTIDIPVEHYIDTDSNFNIYISKGTEDVYRIADTINELFVSLLGRDLQRFRPDLVRFLNTAEKTEYLRDYDIVETRIAEIKNSLETTERTQKQRFWEAILNTKTISERKKIFVEKDIDFEELSTVFEMDIGLIHHVDTSFNYEQMSDTSNINILVELLEELSLTLKELNSNLFPQIDFRTMYERKLLQIKNQFEDGFNTKLYRYLEDKSTDEQSKYQEFLDRYKYSLEMTVPLNTLELDVSDYFLKMLIKYFEFMSFTADNLIKDYNKFNSTVIYIKSFQSLKDVLSNKEYTEDVLEEYLSNNEIRSLLYFDNVEKISSDFISWYESNIKEEESGDDLEDFAKDLIDDTPCGIETISTGSIGESIVFGGNGGRRSGTRFDGGSGNANKKRIGLIAEMVVFNELEQIYPSNVTWVSKYASKIYKSHPGYNPEGEDGLGYDIEYFDLEDNKYFVEVKGKTDNSDLFEISKNEIDKAIEEQDYYKIIFVKNVMDKEKRKVLDLGNLFMFENHETFFSNQKFTVNYKNFEIRFQEKRPS